MQTWTDTSLAIHKDMKGYTGGVILLGRGLVIHHCVKQKLNAKSSTKAEIIGVSDFLPYTIWATYFMCEQGYNMTRNIFHQDNTSAIKMITNGRASYRSGSRNIHIRYFFAKDVLEKEKIAVCHCSYRQHGGRLLHQAITRITIQRIEGNSYWTQEHVNGGAC